MRLPILYTITKSGKIKSWEIFVESSGDSSTLTILSGFVGGTITKFEVLITQGKNLTKNNRTTHITQAISEMESKWNKKKDQGYTENRSGVPSETEIKYLPMLALEYRTRHKDIIFPCYVQPKLDGVRGVYYNGSIYSRMGKKFFGLEHITDELCKVKAVLDGELYSDELSFQEIISTVRKTTRADPRAAKIKFIVYDTMNDSDYKDRLELLKKVIKFKNTKLIETVCVDKKSEIDYFHDKFVSENYEGLILRNLKGPYQQKNRSKNLQKLKVFMDSEFEITGFSQGASTELGAVIWECKLPGSEKTFNVRPQGTFDKRKELYKNARKYIGKLLTVKYFEMTGEGIPRFPVGISIRDYE